MKSEYCKTLRELEYKIYENIQDKKYQLNNEKNNTRLFCTKNQKTKI